MTIQLQQPQGYVLWKNEEGSYSDRAIASSYDEAISHFPDTNYVDHFVFNLYHIVKFNDDGEKNVLASFWSYDDADASLDEYCERYPHAMVDIDHSDW